MQAVGNAKQIHWAARRGDTQAIQRELDRGVDVDSRDYDDETPLMCAVMGRHADLATVEFLVSAGADVNALSQTLQATPLIHAARKGRLEVVRFLLARGADPVFATKGGYTPLGAGGYLPVIEELLQAGAGQDISDPSGFGPAIGAWNSGHFEAVKLYLRHGASLQALGMTPLSEAIALGTIQDVRAEVKRGANLEKRDQGGRTPWMLAVSTGEVEKARLLLSDGAERGGGEGRSWSALARAVVLGHEEMTRWLLSEGANPQECGEHGVPALLNAVMFGRATCARLLLEAGAHVQTATYISKRPMPIIPRARNMETVRALIEFGEDIDAIGDCGDWVLKTAAHDGKEMFVRELLEAGATVDLETTGGTALTEASTWDRLRVVSVLLEHGASPDIEDVDFGTPVTRAASQECLDLLLAAGGKIRPEDDIGFAQY